MSWYEYELIQAERLEEIKMMIEAEKLKEEEAKNLKEIDFIKEWEMEI